jgi:hypothetical protein
LRGRRGHDVVLFQRVELASILGEARRRGQNKFRCDKCAFDCIRDALCCDVACPAGLASANGI